MQIEIKVPSPGESISEVEIARWFVNDGDHVSKEQEIAEIESEKATLPLLASESGQIRILKPAGTAVPVGEVVCTIETSKTGKKKTETAPVIPDEQKVPPAAPAPEAKIEPEKEQYHDVKISPVAQKMMEDHHLSVDDIISGLRRIGRQEVSAVVSLKDNPVATSPVRTAVRDESRTKMSVLRRKLSQRLVAVKNDTAMLTTFNEADMSAIIDIRKTWQEDFQKKYGVKLGFMSFFTRAVSEALLLYPVVNSRIEGEEIVSPAYTDIGIAVQTEKGLMVPVIRNAEVLSIAEIEKVIAGLAAKARTNRIGIEEMAGGTFTITNGGVYGSMMSTPILNPPQSAILGMHSITERAVVRNGIIVSRPMMYLALSYDHRIIDGRDSVGFLMRVKELVEDPLKLLTPGGDPARSLLGL